MTTKLLIVDDNPDVRKTLRLVLGQAYTIVEAATGSDAVRLVQEEHPQLMLLDVSMPGMNGIAVLEAIRARGDRLPVIMLTAGDDIDVAKQALSLGAVEYITKPFDPEYLRMDIARLLEERLEDERPWRVGS